MAQNCHGPFHVPHQTNRRNQHPPNLKDLNFEPLNNQGNLSLSLPFGDQTNSALSVFGDLKEEKKRRRSLVVPLGPFTGYASVLKGSRFLKPAQEVLDDVCGVVSCGMSRFPSVSCWSESDLGTRRCVDFGDRLKNSKLMFLLDEVHKRYKQYSQQMESIVASFEEVDGLANAAPHTFHAFRIVAKHFICLKNALLDQLHITLKAGGGGDGEVAKKSENLLQIQTPALNFFSFIQNPVWRSQRGLPDHAVAVLKSWLFQHFLHPYPTDTEKQVLAHQTGLSRTQVSNWFINARVRLWKPMVEEVHMLETMQSQSQVCLEACNRNTGLPSDLHSGKLLWESGKNVRTKRSRRELVDVSEPLQDRVNGSSCNLSGSCDTACVNGCNVGIDFMWPTLPVNVAEHVNLRMARTKGSSPAHALDAQNQRF